MMLKFGFSILTRSGQKVDSLVIAGVDRADAERKLVQMYRQCTVLTCEVRQPGGRHRPWTSTENILTLISR